MGSLLHLLESDNDALPADTHITHAASGNVIHLHNVILDYSNFRIHTKPAAIEMLSNSSLEFDTVFELFRRLYHDNDPEEVKLHPKDIKKRTFSECVKQLNMEADLFFFTSKIVLLFGGTGFGGPYLSACSHLSIMIESLRDCSEDHSAILIATLHHLLQSTIKDEDLEILCSETWGNHCVFDLFSSEYFGHAVIRQGMKLCKIVPQTFDAMKMLFRLQIAASHRATSPIPTKLERNRIRTPLHTYMYSSSIYAPNHPYEDLYYQISISGLEENPSTVFIGFLLKWPYFCSLLGSGLQEVNNREIVLPSEFPQSALDILLYALGGYYKNAKIVCPDDDILIYQFPSDFTRIGVNFLMENAIQFGLANVDGIVYHHFRRMLGIDTVAPIYTTSSPSFTF